MCSPEHKYFLSVLLSQRARQGDGGFFPAAHALASASRSIYWSHSATWPKADEEGGKTKSNEREKGGFCAACVCKKPARAPFRTEVSFMGLRELFRSPAAAAGGGTLGCTMGGCGARCEVLAALGTAGLLCDRSAPSMVEPSQETWKEKGNRSVSGRSLQPGPSQYCPPAPHARS